MNPHNDIYGLWNELYSFEHNYLLDGSLFGQAHFNGSCIWYEANIDLSISAFPLPFGSPRARQETYELARQAARSVRKKERRSLKLFGDADIVSDVLFEFQDIGEIYYSTMLRSGDFIMDDPNHLANNKAANRAAERSVREGFRVVENANGALSAHHIAIMRNFVITRDVAEIDLIFLASTSLWVTRDDIRLFDVILNGNVVSFFLVHEWSSRLGFFLANFSQSGLHYIGDAIMSFLYRRYVRTGGRVFLGPALDTDNETFKRKWARDVGNGPTSGAFFTAEETAGAGKHLNMWWARAAQNFANSSS